MWMTTTDWNDGSKKTILQWETEQAAESYAKRMRNYGYLVEVRKLP